MTRIQGLSPVIGNNPKMLILGSMPGRVSLRKQEYYGHDRNLFWKLIYAVYGRSLCGDYADRILFLKDRSIALWDVLRECSRENTGADSAIKNGVPNDIPGLLRKNPSIRYIIFNGRKAEDLFKMHFQSIAEQRMYALPSTSPANARYTFEQKLKQWSMIRELLINTRR